MCDEAFMQQALLLAERGLYTTHPNPRVGCVLVKDNKIIGEGWHERAGGPHAEVVALRSAGEQAKGATGYVTLEPCCHRGKTPPCSEALMKAGVQRIVIAMLDPNPLVSGKSIDFFNQVGLQVTTGVLEEAARRLNPGFFKRMQSGRPYVRCKLGMSLDGRTAAANGESRWITSEEARRDGQRFRAQSSGVLTGIKTILSDDPLLNVREISIPKQPLRIIVDTDLRTPITAKVLTEPEGVVVFTACEETSKIKVFEGLGIRVIRAKRYVESPPLKKGGQGGFSKVGSGLSLDFILSTLAKRFEQNEILLEAGPTLAGAFLSQELLDELVLYVAPKILGDLSYPLFHLPALQTLSQAIPLKIQSVDLLGDDVRIITSVKFE